MKNLQHYCQNCQSELTLRIVLTKETSQIVQHAVLQLKRVLLNKIIYRA